MPEPSMPDTASIVSVCVVHDLVPGDGRMSAIDKRPVAGPVPVGPLGVAGDRQVDRAHHGGVDKAVYAYATESARLWAERLGREIPPGTFGENLATSGLDVDGALIGEQWQVGDPGTGPLLEVRMPRTPCANLAIRMGIPGFAADFQRAGRPGAYLKVLHPGTVATGDPVTVTFRPEHEVTVAALLLGTTPDAYAALLACGIDLALAVRSKAQRGRRRQAGA